MIKAAPLLLTFACMLGACVQKPLPKPTVAIDTTAPVEAQPAWRGAIQANDLLTIDSLPATWTNTLASVARSQRKAVDAEGDLLRGPSGLDHAALPPGSYNCRVIRLGAVAGKGGLRAFPPQFCFVQGESEQRLSFTKQTGSELPSGWLYPDGDKRYVFLGTLAAGPEAKGATYGSDHTRDVVGVVERVGLFKWRLVVPRAVPGGMWIYELTPVPADQQPSAD